jgi:hypothetical protein
MHLRPRSRGIPPAPTVMTSEEVAKCDQAGRLEIDSHTQPQTPRCPKLQSGHAWEVCRLVRAAALGRRSRRTADSTVQHHQIADRMRHFRFTGTAGPRSPWRGTSRRSIGSHEEAPYTSPGQGRADAVHGAVFAAGHPAEVSGGELLGGWVALRAISTERPTVRARVTSSAAAGRTSPRQTIPSSPTGGELVSALRSCCHGAARYPSGYPRGFATACRPTLGA